MTSTVTRSTPVWRERLLATGRALLDLLYPPRCAGCGRLGALFCADCQAQVVGIWPPACWRCGRPMDREGLCAVCRRTSCSLDAIFAAAVFAPPLREAIHQLKYGHRRGLARPLGERMAAAWRQVAIQADLIVPVPLHPSRQAERGYNQSALLAQTLGAAVRVPVAEHLLLRQRPTPPQIGLSIRERQANVHSAFACQADIEGQRIVIVDDVCTTGSTLEACAAALRVRGAAVVIGLALARARWSAHADPNSP